MKVLWVNNIPAPYKVDLMNLLGREVDLTVLFEYHTEENREEQWYRHNFDSFKGNYVKNFFVDLFKYGFGDYDFFLNSDYSKPFCILMAIIYRLRGKRVIMQADGGIAKDRGFLVNSRMGFVMRISTDYISSGKYTNYYYTYYKVDERKIRKCRFTTLTNADVANNRKMSEQKIHYKKKLNMPLDKTILLTVGQQVYRKGYDVLIKAAAQIKGDYMIYIVGGKPEASNQKLIEELNLKNIVFVDFCGKEDLAEYYAASDVFVFPTREDIWGLVVDEAMSFGLPLISSDNCVAAKEFNDLFHNCVLFENENIDELAEAMQLLLQDEDTRNQLAANSLMGAQDDTLEMMAQDYLRVFHEVINK